VKPNLTKLDLDHAMVPCNGTIPTQKCHKHIQSMKNTQWTHSIPQGAMYKQEGTLSLSKGTEEFNDLRDNANSLSREHGK